MKKNAYLEKLQEQKRLDNQLLAQHVESVIRQYDSDTLIITIHEEFGWGYDRIMRLLLAWKERQVTYREAVNPDNKDKQNESDYWQEQLDRMMVQIIRGKQDLIPFDERYPTLEKIKY
jgi:hypothetical protein